MGYYLGVDLGGTNIVVGLVDDSAGILFKKAVRTNAPRGPEDICTDIALLCGEVLAEAGQSREDIAWIGIGSPGVIHDNVIIYANNLEFHNVPLGRILEEKTGIRSLLQNDANAAAYGEFVAGTGRGCRSMVAVTLGTGVGGGVILEGRVVTGFGGCAGEIGHMITSVNGRQCTCGKRGCMEAYCSATAIRAMTKEAMERHPDSLMWELVREKGRISAKTPFQAARQGDTAAQEIVAEFLEHLSTGVSNIVGLLQPEVISLGGGVSREGDDILLPLRERVAQLTFLREDQMPRIVTSCLGGDAGLIGAALAGRQAELQEVQFVQ